MEEKRLFTSESVTEGHPDKICDQISDAVLDALMEHCSIARSTWHLPIRGLPDFIESLLSVTLNKRNVIY